ncbi:MAG TPA: hypothetical protein VJW75_04420 [Candidatus Eisenbacteria bacterium]|nr:hypothetical protein [Candidatus Eisenbacteria bacterium]
MTTRGKSRTKGWSVTLWGVALAASLQGVLASEALAGSEIQPDHAGPDSAFASLRVETLPPGLLVVIDGVRVGRAPVGPLWLPAKRVLVQALSPDPRRFEPGRDGATVTLTRGRDTTIVIDLRPSVLLRSVPEPASVALVHPVSHRLEAPAAQTPIRLLPAALSGRAIRLEATAHADTTLSDEALLALATAGDGVATIALRRVAPDPLPTVKRKPIWRRTWVRLSLIGIGAALTGSAAILRREGDRWYERYQASSDPDVIPVYFDKTVHYDRLASASLGTGQVAITLGLLLLVTESAR